MGVFSTELACPRHREAGLVVFVYDVEEGFDVASGVLEPNRTTDGKYATTVLTGYLVLHISSWLWFREGKLWPLSHGSN